MGSGPRVDKCLLVMAALALAFGACSSPAGKPDTGVTDAPVNNDTPSTTDTPPDMPPATDTPAGDDAADGGVDDAAPTTDATDGPTIECAPAPTGGPTPSGTDPMQAPGPTVTSAATRPELSADVADSKYTIRKALAQGYLINNGTPPDGGAGPVTYSANDNWDPLTNGIGDPATFTPMFTVAADGSGTHTSLMTAFTDANAL